MGTVVRSRAENTYNGKTESDRLREAEAVVEAFNAGQPVSYIMDMLGVSEATVWRRYRAGLDHRLSMTVDEYRKSQDVLLDKLMGRHEHQLRLADRLVEYALAMKAVPALEAAMERRGKVLDAMLRVAERRARLHGLDRPVQVDVQVAAVSTEDAEMIEAIRAAKAQRQAQNQGAHQVVETDASASA